MHKSWHRKWLVVLVVVLGYISFVVGAIPAKAQQVVVESLGVAHYVPFENIENLRNGMIISHIGNEYQISNGEYNKDIIGVYAEAPAIALEPQNTDGQIPLITAGTVEVLVNTSGGPIQRGDFITTSSTPGIGMRAGKSGFMLGIAQESFGGEGEETGTINVMLDIKFAYGPDTPESEMIMSRLLTVISASRLAAIEDPAVAFRTLVASLLLILSLIVALVTFIRVAQKGIEALGRNPLASRRITVGIVMNLGIALIIIAVGIGAAYFLVSLAQ